MTEQEKFEVMFSDPSVDKTKRHCREDQYKDLTTSLLWEGWQAAIASREPMPLEKAEEIAHRTASKYTHKSDRQFTAYTFLPHTLEDFVRKVERFHGIGE